MACSTLAPVVQWVNVLFGNRQGGEGGGRFGRDFALQSMLPYILPSSIQKLMYAALIVSLLEIL